MTNTLVNQSKRAMIVRKSRLCHHQQSLVSKSYQPAFSSKKSTEISELDDPGLAVVNSDEAVVSKNVVKYNDGPELCASAVVTKVPFDATRNGAKEAISNEDIDSEAAEATVIPDDFAKPVVLDGYSSEQVESNEFVDLQGEQENAEEAEAPVDDDRDCHFELILEKDSGINSNESAVAIEKSANPINLNDSSSKLVQSEDIIKDNDEARKVWSGEENQDQFEMVHGTQDEPVLDKSRLQSNEHGVSVMESAKTAKLYHSVPLEVVHYEVIGKQGESVKVGPSINGIVKSSSDDNLVISFSEANKIVDNSEEPPLEEDSGLRLD